MDKRERNRTAILSALSKIASPASSSRLVEFLSAAGQNLSERTVRLYLHEMDTEGLVTSKGRKQLGISLQPPHRGDIHSPRQVYRHLFTMMALASQRPITDGP